MAPFWGEAVRKAVASGIVYIAAELPDDAGHESHLHAKFTCT